MSDKLNEFWNKVSDGLPKKGVLCLVYMPIGINRIDNSTTGPTATAYYRENEGWIRADQPVALSFKPYYWHPLDLTIFIDATELPYVRTYKEFPP